MDLLSSAIGGVTGEVRKVERFVAAQWTQRLVQVSVYGGLLFYLLSMTDLIKTVDKNLSSVLGLKLGLEGTRALHGVVFAFFMYVGIRFILDPFIKRLTNGSVEGMKNKRPAPKAQKRPVGKAPQKRPVKRKAPARK